MSLYDTGITSRSLTRVMQQQQSLSPGIIAHGTQDQFGLAGRRDILQADGLVECRSGVGGGKGEGEGEGEGEGGDRDTLLVTINV